MNLTATAPEYLEELKKCRLIQHIVNFNGSNTKIESNNPVNFHLGNKNVTAEAWVYLRSGTGYHVILENAKFDNTKLRGMRLFVQDAKVYFAAFDGGTSGNAHVNTIGTIPLNQWVHIAATKHHGSSITYTIHINGTSVSLNTNNTDAPDGTGMTISQNVAIGYSKVNNTSYFNGHIRNVRIYNRRLTTTEIGANYNSGCISEPAITEGLIYYTRLDNGHGTTISDLAYPSTATLSNGTWEIKALPGTACLSTAELAQVVLCDKGGYRFGFNGKPNDNEVCGDGNWQDYGLRMYSTRLGRFPSPDPLIKQYPWYTPYQFSGNNPIRFIDLDGGEPKDPPGMWLSNPGSKDFGDHYHKGGTLTLVNDKETKAKYYVYQQTGINGGSDFHWYNQDAKKWLPFSPTGYVEQGSWQITEQGQGNFAAFQGAIKSNQGMLNFAAGFAYGAASLATGGLGGLSGGSVTLGLDRLAAGISDMGVQLAIGKSFGKDYNFTSTLANFAFPNSPLISSAIGTYGEATTEAGGFTLGTTKSFGRATFEMGINTLGNIGGAKVAEYGISLDRAMPKYEQFGIKLLGNSVGNSTSAAVAEVK